MPRYIGNSTFTKRVQQSDAERKRRTFVWVDPFPDVHGTLPEKMVYAELTRLGVPFLFLNDVTINIPEIGLLKDYQADFVIPAAKLIIEVQGAHWHSMDATIEADAYKFALYESMGYKALAWWDYEILAGVQALAAAEPLIMGLATYPVVYGKSGELPVVKRTKVDTSKGIRTLNRKRAYQHGTKSMFGKRTVRKGVTSYAASR